MIFAKRIAVVFFAAVLIILIILNRPKDYHSTLQGLSQSVGLGELVEDDGEVDSQHVNKLTQPTTAISSAQSDSLAGYNASTFQAPSNPLYEPVTLKPTGAIYTRGLVIGRLSTQNTTWLDSYSPTDPDLTAYVYVVDDRTASLHTPLNKGHEAMVYLTYILDHYDSLPDISIFMHHHQIAWHTPELLNHDAVEVLKRLSNERVTREGYMNLRCNWDPGCPERIYPGRTYRDNGKREEIAVAAAWSEMFPDDPIPNALGAPCCAQFAVSRERLKSIPKTSFERYRSWLIRTKEDDWISGRVFEYLWQKIFTDQAKVCPDARACYCDGYGVCFITPEMYEEWFDMHRHWREAVKELEKWEERAAIIDGIRNWNKVEQMKLDIPIPGRNRELKKEIDQRFQFLVAMRTEALKNGTDPEVRARVAGKGEKIKEGY